MDITERTEYIQGAEAYHAELIVLNPYEADSEEYLLWSEGWWSEHLEGMEGWL